MPRKDDAISLAVRLAPEDLRPRMYIAALTEVAQLYPCVDTWSPRQNLRTIRVECLPVWLDEPLRVVDVCLPFVLVEDKDGDRKQVDTRRHTLVRLSERYGRRAFGKKDKEPVRRSTRTPQRKSKTAK